MSFSQFFREGAREPGGTLSMTRLVLFISVVAGVLPLFVWSYLLARYAWAPDIPANVWLAMSTALGIPVALKYGERREVERTKQVQMTTPNGDHRQDPKP